MRLYRWSPMHEVDDTTGVGRHESVARHDVGRDWIGVPLTTTPPDPGVGLLVVLEIPDEVVSPYEVADGRYLVPADVIRPYPASVADR